MRRFSLLVCCFLALFTVSLAAQQPIKQGRVSGRVFNDTTPVAAASVTLTQQGENGAIRTSSTNEEGRFFVDHLPLGNYTLKIENIGFRPIMITGIKLTEQLPVAEFNSLQMKQAMIAGVVLLAAAAP